MKCRPFFHCSNLLFTFVLCVTFLIPAGSRAQTVGELIGRISASDPDTATILTYTIIEGNTDEAFCFGRPPSLGPDHTGYMYVNNANAVQRFMKFTLRIKVTDNGIPSKPEPQCYAIAKVRIKYPDLFLIYPE